MILLKGMFLSDFDSTSLGPLTHSPSPLILLSYTHTHASHTALLFSINFAFPQPSFYLDEQKSGSAERRSTHNCVGGGVDALESESISPVPSQVPKPVERVESEC